MGQSQDKVYSSLGSADQSRLRNKFDKISQIKGGSAGNAVSIQGFKSLFPTNKKFAKKLFMWATKSTETVINTMDFKQFVKCAEFFLVEFQENQTDVGQYSKVELFGIASFNNQISGNEFDREFVNRVEITYSEALQFIKELTFILFDPVDMQNPHTENDDIAAKVVANGIFKQKEKLEFYTFFEIFNQQFTEADKIVQDYFSKIFLGKPIYDYTIPEYYFEDPEDEQPSLILRKGISALLCMSHENFGKYGFMKPLFEHIAYDGEEFDFETFSNELLSYDEGPTLILARHFDQFEEVDVYAQAKSGTKERVGKNHHVLGILNSTKYRQYPQLSGDSTTTLFSMIPNFKVFSPARGEMERQYANLSTSEQTNGVPAGLLIGGDPKSKARVFIGKDIHFSYIDNYGSIDKTYERGNIFDSPQIDQLKIDIIEVWGLTNKGVKKEVVAAPVVQKQYVQEDYGIMKPQDDGYVAELEDVHSKATKIPVQPRVTEDFYNEPVVHHHHSHHHIPTAHQQSTITTTHVIEKHSYVKQGEY